MLLVEEKQVPIKIELVPMRSYGDKPAAFMRKVPNGLLPAIEVNGQVITECKLIVLSLLPQNLFQGSLLTRIYRRRITTQLSPLQLLSSWNCWTSGTRTGTSP
jgi:glutathione S-transferase